MNVRTIIAPEMLEPESLRGKYQERATDEHRRDRSRRNVKAWRARNPEKWAEIQRNWRARRRKRLGLPPAKVYKRRAS